MKTSIIFILMGELSVSLTFAQSTEQQKPITERVVRSNQLWDLELAKKHQAPDTVKNINFSDLGLHHFPEIVYQFANVEDLNLDRNNLTTLPDDLLLKLPKLKKLSVANNRLDVDKLKFSRNKHLEHLNMQANDLHVLPTSIRHNKALQSLWIGNNPLEPERCIFSGLRQLKELNMYHCELKTCPKSIKKLKRLEEIDLYHNQLFDLPLKLPKSLKTLAVSYNHIEKLPSNLHRLQFLSKIYIHHNRLYALPELPVSLEMLDLSFNYFSILSLNAPALKELDLSNNSLKQVDDSWERLPKLEKLFLRANPFLKDVQRRAIWKTKMSIFEQRNVSVFD